MNISEIENECSKYKFWEKLDENQKNQIVNGTSIDEYKKNQLIYSPSKKCNGMIKVITGKCRIYMLSEEGREITLYTIESGDICTLSASCVIDEIDFEVFMTTEEDTKLLVTNAFTLKKLKDNNIYLDNFIYKETVSKFSKVILTMQEILFVSINKRLRKLLVQEAENNSIKNTHEEIAQKIGSAREVVSRMLKDFEKKGLIILSRGEIKIIDMDRLMDI